VEFGHVMISLPLLRIVVGVALLLFGRRLFWLFVAGVGFVFGTLLATEWLEVTSDWLMIVIALGVGVIGAIASVLLQRLTVAIAGFFAGGYVLLTLASSLEHEPIRWVAFVIGGIFGTLFVLALFDWALIVLSALSGATLIAENVAADRPTSALIWIAMLILGVVVQTRQLTRATTAPAQARS
jgi:hypothetical protein